MTRRVEIFSMFHAIPGPVASVARMTWGCADLWLERTPRSGGVLKGNFRRSTRGSDVFWRALHWAAGRGESWAMGSASLHRKRAM